MSRAAFSWEDPFLLDDQLTEDERMIRDAAHAYCQEKLLPRVVDAFNGLLAGIDPAVATTVISERSNLDVSAIPGDAQLAVLEKIAPVLVESGDVQGGQESVDKALSSIINDTFATKAGAGE